MSLKHVVRYSILDSAYLAEEKSIFQTDTNTSKD